VALLATDVSEELSASIIKVTRISELGTLAVTSNRWLFDNSLIFVTLMMEVLSSFETSVLIRATRRNIPEDVILYAQVLFRILTKQRPLSGGISAGSAVEE
jgi:hypothetical protein